MFAALEDFCFFVQASSFGVEYSIKKDSFKHSGHIPVMGLYPGQYLPCNFILNAVFTLLCSPHVASVRALEISDIVCKCGFRSVGRIVECCVVSIHSYFPHSVTKGSLQIK